MAQNENTLLDVLLVLKDAIFKSLKVATLAIVQSVDSTNKILTVHQFPQETEQTSAIQCRYLNDDSVINKGDIVLVLFLDMNFLANLRKLQKGVDVILQNADETRHSEKFGIAIKTL